VGTDAGTDRYHSGCAGARPGRAANVYSLSRGTEQSFEHHPTLGARSGSRALSNVEGTLACARGWRSEISHGIPGTNWYNHYTATGNWEGMLLVSFSNPKYKQFEGKRMSEVIRALDKPPIDVLFELLENNNGSVPTVYFHHSEDDMRYR